ncbi:MAG: GAF domain-containing protein, partial [Chloroflexota bacterium]
IVGVLCADKDELHGFDNFELNLFEAIAKHISIGFSKSKLYTRIKQQREDQTSAIQEIADSILEGQDEEILFNKIAQLSHHLFKGSDFVVLRLNNENEHQLDLAAYITGEKTRTKDIAEPLSFDKGILGKVAISKELTNISNVSKYSDYYSPFVDPRSFGSQLAAPILLEGGLLGILSVEHPECNAFDAESENLAMAIANLTAVAITNRNLIAQRTEEIRRLQELQRVSTQMLSYERDSNAVLKQIVESIQTFFHQSTCAIRVFNSETDSFDEPVYVGDIDLKDAFGVPRADGITFHTINNQNPYFVLSADIHDEKDGPNIRPELYAKGIRAAVSYSLSFQQHIVGSLYIYMPTSYVFSPIEERLLHLFADQAATAIANSQSNQKIIEGISRISNSISIVKERTQATLLQEIIDAVAILFEAADLYQVWKLSSDQLSLEVIAVRDEANRSAKRLTQNQGVVGKVAREEGPQLINDVSQNEYYYMTKNRDEENPTGSELAVPIFYQSDQKLFGVLNIENQAVNAFAEEDLKLAISIANLLSVALDNTEEIVNARQRAIDAEQVLTYSLLSGQILHRLNQTIANIPAELSLLQLEFDSSNSRDKYISNEISGMRDVILNLAKNIQDMERKYNLATYRDEKEIDVNELVSIVVGQRNGTLSVYLEENLPTITATREIFQSILDNLISNAELAIKGKLGGKIVISTKAVYLDEKLAVQISIEDNGVGIPLENQSKIFELGFSTKANGWGIGLFIDQYYLRSIGSELTFESEANKGTIFKIVVPVLEG